MDEQLARVIGARVRTARAVNHQTQVVVAGLAGITTDYLYQIERGKKLPTVPVLLALASALNLPGSSLIDQPLSAAPPRPTARTGDALYRALTRPVPAADPLPVETLRRHIAGAWRTWQTSPSRYSRLSAEAPNLIVSVNLAERAHRDDLPAQRAVQRSAIELYGLIRTVGKRLGRLDIALLAADRAVQTAEAAGEPVGLAAARWNLAHVLLAEHELDGAESVTRQAVEALRAQVAAGDRDAMALSRALLLLGAVARVRQGDVWTARELLRQAAPLAARTGEHNLFWTAFGPTNVAMYAVSIEAEAGEAAEALRLAEQVGYERSPSIERRVAFLLEQARSYEQRRDYGSALALLRTASREAPEDVAHRPAAQRLVQVLIHRGRRTVSSEAALLAADVGLALD
jgi:transcriptional regulator with XRE-family HTH domain